MLLDVPLKAFGNAPRNVGVRVEVDIDDQSLHAAFFINDPHELIDWTYPGNVQNLYEHSCIELFLHSGAERYVEYNFAANRIWRCYRFDNYRQPSSFTAETSDNIRFVICEPGNIELVLQLRAVDEFLNKRFKKIGISTVLKLKDGQRTYWAAGHPSDKPDFHNALFYLQSIRKLPKL